jgi:hypothetical protein
MTDPFNDETPVKFHGTRYGRVPEWLLRTDVKDGALRVYAVLQCYYGQYATKMPGVRRLSEEAGKGRTQTLDALKELERVGAIRRTRRNNGGGHRTTDLYEVAFDEPLSENPPSGIPDVGETNVRDSGPREGLGPESRTGTGPETRTAYVDGSEVDEDPSSVVPTAEVARSARAIQEEEELQQKPPIDPAAQFLMDLEPPWRLGPIDAAALAPTLTLIAGARGWEPDRHLAAALTANPGGIRNYAVVLRTRIDNLPMRHTRPAPAADRVCIDCARPHPNLYDNGVCPNCIRTDNRAPAPINLRDLIQPTTGHPKP